MREGGLGEHAAGKLTIMFREMLASPVEIALRHFDDAVTSRLDASLPAGLRLAVLIT